MRNEFLLIDDRAQLHEQAKGALSQRLVDQPGNTSSLGAEKRLEHHVTAQRLKTCERIFHGLSYHGPWNSQASR